MTFRALNLRHSLSQRANTKNVSFQTLYSGHFTFSTELIILNYPVILSHPLYLLDSQLVSQSVTQSVNELVSQSVSQPISQSASPSVHQSVSPSVSQSISQSVRWSVNPLVSQSVSPLVSQSVS